ncbi:hypothetical protein COV56_00310 [Candidatus Kuenenbacteria bacterium CG11_big_fil_rev_8_21_14_0_20_37_9]|uniref:Glycosyltransferase RgtA/B/C/D-like domain-containing protein n=2 Tax=Candidatus Kueneniibacteriota TaxID=1752740 RepID=A0A2M6XSG8_9BACT|nr:MAG: hypothetical protein AUJ29_00590 [Candidatus Kuenenbacteria bacterium CG1_02_38_13]PIR05907.1 MAG: hypothetical protein COV56_00310 [Candidatus Kuenenbacteria bacterium CG11_big_fil_rev_8_21_14_0_20_37_9]PIU10582.1 MAG: hypothetical protein COT27_02330 [Candidatus Kuenenbacteria bacterium CG08_land_8_20_14_0_20_37_23]
MLSNLVKSILNSKIFLFLLFLIIAVWLVAIPLKNIGSVLPSGGDPYLVTYIWSWEMRQIPIDIARLFDANIFAPFKNTLAFTEHMLGSLILAWPIFLISKNIVLTFNLVSLLSFAIAGLGMYLLAYYLSKNKLASLVAAFIYAFAPIKIHHLEHINLSGMWLPYFFLSLEKFFNKQTWKNSWLLFICAMLVFLNAMQYFLFLPLVIILFFLKNILAKRFVFSRDVLIKFFIFILFFLVIAIPLYLPYLQIQHELGFKRDIRTIEGLSPDLADYFISPFFYKYFYPSLFGEWAIGPGLFVIFLLLAASIYIYKKTGAFQDYLIYYLIGLIAFLFSFGYFIQFTRADPSGLVGPWAFFYHFIPGFDGVRAIGRYSIFLLLSAAVIIAIGLSALFKQKIHNFKKRIILTLALIVLLLLEFSYVQPIKYMPVSIGTPLIYDWLKNQSEANIYLEMPAAENYFSQDFDSFYTFYAGRHFKKIVNGYSGYAPSAYERLNGELVHFDMGDIQLIKDYGATHIIFHFDYYPRNFKERTMKELEKSKKARLIKSAANDYVYEIL